MKLLNPLKSLSWRSLFRRPRNRLRTRASSFSPAGCFAAEVLENRALLSAANVNLTVSAAGAMTLTSTDANNDTIHMYRNGSGNIQFNAFGGTQITYKGTTYSGYDALELTIPTVQSITVNLGKGYSEYHIHDINTVGNVQFVGKAGGIDGADLEVYSKFSDTTIGGSIISNVVETGSDDSYFDVYTRNGYNLTVNGSVTSAQLGTGSGYRENEVYTESSGDLWIKGAIVFSTAGSGEHDNEAETYDTGNITVGLGIAITDSGNGYHQAEIECEDEDGDDVGNVFVGGSVAIVDSGNGDHYHEIAAEESGASLTICGNVTVVDSGTGATGDDHYHETEILADTDNAPLLIKGSVTVVDAGTAHGIFYIHNNSDADSPVTVNGSVTYTHSNTVGGHDDVEFYGSAEEENALVTIKGAVTLNLSKVASTADDANGSDSNYIYLGSNETDAGEGYGLVVNGPTTIVGGNGEDYYNITEARFNGIVNINTMSNPTTAGFNDYIEIDGSLFAGVTNTFTMAGKGAVLSMNNSSSFLDDSYTPEQDTEFKGSVLVTMNGPGASIHVADDPAEFDETLVKFDSLVRIVGGTGGIPAGTLFVSTINSSFATPAVRTNFALVTVP